MELLFLSALVISTFSQTPLDDFINMPDDTYAWTETNKTLSGNNIGGHWSAFLLNLTSQSWLNHTFVDKPVWWHWLWCVIPEKLDHNDFATMIGTGNKNSQNPPDLGDEYLLASTYVATHTNTIVCVLYNIPNEPLVFYNDPLQKSRSEDAIIAFGWNVFMQMYDSDPDDNFRYQWLTHFPMAKATIKAMDTVETWAAAKMDIHITRWATAGASKRGWSTWLTAAADQDRIVAFIPMVMDMPNLHSEMHHMWRAYGGWTFAFGDYYAENLTMYIDTPAFLDLCNATDPVVFFDRYEGMWKMPIDAINDEFFMPDDEHYWWNQFPQPKWFQMNPDAEHSLSTAIEELVPTLSTFLVLYLESITMPTISWSIYNQSGNISVSYQGNTSQIIDARVWHGRSCGTKRRDFRLINIDDPCLCGVEVSNGEYCTNIVSVFENYILQPNSMDSTSAMYMAGPSDYPNNHWTGFFISLRVKFFDAKHPFWGYSLDNNNSTSLGDNAFVVEYGEMQFTTQVSITPQTFPFPPCSGAECYGTLV